MGNTEQLSTPRPTTAGREFPSHVDEFEETGLTPTPAHRLEGVPRVAESPLHLECQLHDTMEVGDGSYGASTPVMCSGAARVECDCVCVRVCVSLLFFQVPWWLAMLCMLA